MSPRSSRPGSRPSKRTRSSGRVCSRSGRESAPAEGGQDDEARMEMVAGVARDHDRRVAVDTFRIRHATASDDAARAREQAAAFGELKKEVGRLRQTTEAAT